MWLLSCKQEVAVIEAADRDIFQQDRIRGRNMHQGVGPGLRDLKMAVIGDQ